MSASKNSARILRKQKPPRYWYAHRSYLKFLLKDFEERCAYSCQHLQRVGGPGGMDIDHHNPRLKHPEKNKYTNLYLASRHCNGKKSHRWPTTAQRVLGIRFLDPCKEQDYGVHLFEDPETFEIWGVSPAGRYHVRILDLNADHLVRERRRRFEFSKIKESPVVVTVIGPFAQQASRAFLDEIKEMIPLFPQKKKPLAEQNDI